MDMKSEGVVVPVAGVDRANDLHRVRRAAGAIIGAIGGLDRPARVAQFYRGHPQTAVTRPRWAHTAVAGAFGGTQPEPAGAPSPGGITRYQQGLR